MFEKYSSITNAYRDEFITKCQLEIPEKIKWIVTEKVHGANFSFLIEGDRISYCSRNRVLKEVVQIYGEYAGNGIQKGTNYGEQDFYCFDIKVDGKYLNAFIVFSLCNAYKIPHVPIIGMGSLIECLKMNNEFPTKLSPKEGNICEGIVIKPINPFYLSTGERAIIKNKNDAWAEKSKKPQKPKAPITENIKKQLEEFSKYINKNRVNAVISKDPQWQTIDNRNFGKLVQEVIKDIEEETSITVPKKYASKLVASIVRKVVFGGK